MKKIRIISKSGLSTLWVLCLLYQHAQAQSPSAYTGMWEGTFMEQFTTVILLDMTEAGSYAGKILMYSGEKRIQDDELSQIIIESQTLTFCIAAKETTFEGVFNESTSELSGDFIFPDNSRHPLTVRKYDRDSAAVESKVSSPEERKKLYFPVEELKSDVKDLVEKLKKYHPRLYSYTSEEAFNKQVQEINAQLNKEMSLEQFYLEIAPLITSVKCSHTGIRLPDQYQRYLHEEAFFFPLQLFIDDMKAYCLELYGESNAGLGPEPGSEIISINKVPVKQIIGELLSIIPSEGNNITRKYQELNRDFQSYFHLLNPSERFLIEYNTSGSQKTVQVEACPYEELKPRDLPAGELKPYAFHMESEPEYGMLKVASFGISNIEEYFSFLDSIFILLNTAGTPALVVDLRDNTGGHPIFAAQLFSYLTDKEFTYFRRNPDIAEFEPLYHPMQANQNHYRGKIYVLVTGGCLSSTGHLISLVRYHTEALFIGEEPGSSFRCNDFSIQQQLPHTGIELNIPRTTFRTAVKGVAEKEPFQLDYQVTFQVEDLLQGRDTYIFLVEDLIRKSIS